MYKKLANGSLLTFWHIGSYFWTETPSDPLITFLPVVMYIQFVKLLVTSHIFFIASSSLELLEKAVRNILVLASFFCHCRQIFLFFNLIIRFVNIVERKAPTCLQFLVNMCRNDTNSVLLGLKE